MGTINKYLFILFFLGLTCIEAGGLSKEEEQALQKLRNQRYLKQLNHKRFREETILNSREQVKVSIELANLASLFIKLKASCTKTGLTDEISYDRCLVQNYRIIRMINHSAKSLIKNKLLKQELAEKLLSLKKRMVRSTENLKTKYKLYLEEKMNRFRVENMTSFKRTNQKGICKLRAISISKEQLKLRINYDKNFNQGKLYSAQRNINQLKILNKYLDTIVHQCKLEDIALINKMTSLTKRTIYKHTKEKILKKIILNCEENQTNKTYCNKPAVDKINDTLLSSIEHGWIK